MVKALDVLCKLVEQIEKSALTDDHGHSFDMNVALIEAQEFLCAEKEVGK